MLVRCRVPLVLAAVALMGCDDANWRLNNKKQPPTRHEPGTAAKHETTDRPKRSLVGLILDDRLAQARQRILSNPSEIRVVDEIGVTPIQAASVRNHLPLIKLLVKLGADVNAVGNGYYAPLHSAARRGHSKLVAYLLSKGAKVDLPNRYYKRTALWYAAEQGHVEIVRQLLRAGADPHRKDSGGVSPLAQARLEDIEQRRLSPRTVRALAKRVKQKARPAVRSLLTRDFRAVVKLMEKSTTRKRRP